MLKSIKISNFKSIDEEIELSFEPAVKKELNEYYLTRDNLLKLALIYGPNASGKTNIIKAIDFLRSFIFNPPKDKEEKINITPFKFKDSIEKNSKFVLEFIEDNMFFVYEIELNSENVVKETLKYKNLTLKKPRFALIFERDENIIWGNKVKITKSQEVTLQLNTLPNMSLLSGYLRVNVEINEIEKAIKFFKRILPPIFPNTELLGFVLKKLQEGEVSKEEIIKILKNADFAIDDFSIEEKEIEEDFVKFLKQIGKEELNDLKKIEIWFNHFKKYKLEFKDESRGTQRFYQLAVILALLAKNSYIIPMDEIESSLHPDLLKFFILIFLSNSKNSQIILTTHIRELLLEKDILRKDAIWFCEKKENSSTDLFSLSDFGSEIRDNSSIYNYYKYGKIGAVPNIKTFLGLFDEKE
jgi:AAA15 family ATPase/GTPase